MVVIGAKVLPDGSLLSSTHISTKLAILLHVHDSDATCEEDEEEGRKEKGKKEEEGKG